jgi:hypothetical protein
MYSHRLKPPAKIFAVWYLRPQTPAVSGGKTCAYNQSNTVEETRGVKVPAVVVYSGSSFQIASLSILDRLIVALHRAGAGKITVVTDFQLPSLKRTRALNIPFSVDDKAPMFDEGVLFAKAEILAHPTDLRRCIETESRLLSMDGEPLPV